MACYARKKAVDKIKLLAVSDFESKFIWEHFDPAVFKGTDLILSCGDLKASYLSYLVTMIPAPLFYVHGNHDGSYLHRPPEGCVDIDGKVVEYKGLRIGGLGGCKGQNPTSAYQYSEAQMERRARKFVSSMKKNKKLDIFISHAPARGLGDGEGFHEGFDCFHVIHEASQPTLHLFGHLHTSGNPVNKQCILTSGGVSLCNCTGYRFIEWEPGGEITI